LKLVKTAAAAVISLLMFLADAIAASPLRVGVAVADITPRSGNTHDRLFARVLLLRTRDASLALVTSDLRRLQSTALVDRIRRDLRIEHTVLSSSHNASGPIFGPGNADSNWAAEVEKKIFNTVRDANDHLFSADISWGRGSLLGAHNIRIPQEDGTVRERWFNPEEDGTAPVDPSVTVIRVDQEAGSPKAVLVHYACEPVVLTAEDRAISADFPGAVVRYVERELGGNVTCLFAQGGAANIYPYRSRLSGAAAFAEIDRLGQRIGREAVRVARSIKPAEADTDLQVHQASLTFDGRWDESKRLELGVKTVLLNKALALVAVPAEMFVEFQLALSAKSPAATTVLLGSAFSSGKSWAGYVPTITAAVQGGFGASYGTDIEIGAGEALVNHGVVQIYRLLGQLDDLPRGRLQVEVPDLVSP